MAGRIDVAEYGKAICKQRRVDSVHQHAQPRVAGFVWMVAQEAAQEGQIALAPIDHVLEVVAGRDGAAHHEKQNLRQRMGDAPWLPIVKLCGMVKQEQQTRLLVPLDHGSGHRIAATD